MNIFQINNQLNLEKDNVKMLEMVFLAATSYHGMQGRREQSTHPQVFKWKQH